MHRSLTMPKPIIAIPADTREFDGYYWHATPNQYVKAVLKGTGAMAIIVPALIEGNDIDAMLDRVDGVLVSGSRTNVHPSLYGGEATRSRRPLRPGARRHHPAADPPGDRTRHSAARHLPRHPGTQRRARRHAGHRDPRAGRASGITAAPDVPDRDEMYGIRQHVIMIKEGTCIAALLGAGEIQVNSLHRQAIGDRAPSLAVEAVAEDGTIEAVSVIGAKGFAVGVQWHPEYWVESDVVSARAVQGLRRRRQGLCRRAPLIPDRAQRAGRRAARR